MTATCAGLCGEPIVGASVKCDGEVWHPWCRKAEIAERARRRAEALLATDVGAAAALADVQRGPVGRLGRFSPLVVGR